jgi:hypothetical protein
MAQSVHVLTPESTSRPRKSRHETPQLWLERKLHAESPYWSNALVGAGPAYGDHSRPPRRHYRAIGNHAQQLLCVAALGSRRSRFASHRHRRGGSARWQEARDQLMVQQLSAAVRVFVCTRRTDMSKSFDGLQAIVREYLGQDPLSGHLCLFGTDLGIGSSSDHLEGGAKIVLFTVWFLQNCAQLVYFFVLFERGATAGADLVGSFEPRRRVELWVVVHDRLVEIGQGFQSHLGILRLPACGRVRTLYDCC